VTPALTSAVVSIITTALPFLPLLVTDIQGLFAKYPQLTPAQITALVAAAAAQANASAQDTLATIAADQAKTKSTT
jgi:hypothetical protein